jgi:hypothetical protein
MHYNLEPKGGNIMRRIVFILVCLLCVMCINDSPQPPEPVVTRQPQMDESLDQIVVVHFHRVQQCTCCINVGKWAEETITLYFPDEYEAGKIIYMDVCVEENQELARKYNAYGASLFINVIEEGNDNITENADVWKYCHEHDAYVDLFRQVLENILKG